MKFWPEKKVKPVSTISIRVDNKIEEINKLVAEIRGRRTQKKEKDNGTKHAIS